MDWLIQDVCVNTQNQEMPVDPGADNGNGCANAGLAERDLLPGELLPYDKYDQHLSRMADSYPALNAQGTQTLSINPKVSVSTPGALGQYDVHGVQGAWVYGMSTDDPVSYKLNFFGSNCGQTGSAWFPTLNYEVFDGAAPAQGANGDYFEHNGRGLSRCPRWR
jgi:hypothetical protein